MSAKKIKTVYFSTPYIGIPCLNLLATHPLVELTSVVSMPDRKAGRGQVASSPAIINYCKEHKLPYFQTENINAEDEFLQTIKDVDLFVVFAFAQFLKQPVLDIPKLGCFNIHTSILPKYRGAAPIQYALKNGDQNTGVSIQKMVLKMDAGDIAITDEVNLYPWDQYLSLSNRLMFQAPLSLEKLLIQLDAGTVILTPQDASQVSFAPSIKKEECLLNPKELTAIQAINHIRSISPAPCAYIEINDKKLKIYTAETSNNKLEPNQIKNINGQLLLGCKDQSIRLSLIQLAGKKMSKDTEFLNGYKKELNITGQV
jgi:methionyl-tRNA formyltransferase